MVKLKLDDKGVPVLSDGKPVYVLEDGKEVVFDYDSTLNTISRLNGEAKSHRERADAAEKTLKPFVDAGITDPSKAAQALQTVANIDAKKLVDAGEVQRVRDEIEKGYKTQLTEKDTKIGTLESQLYGEKVGGQFARSKFIADKLAIPSDLAQAKFGTNFKLEDGKMVAYDATGNKLYSPARLGELADFDEAMSLLVDAYPHKDSILKGTGQSGSGTPPAGGTPGGGAKQIKRTQFDGMDQAARAKHFADGGTVID